MENLIVGDLPFSGRGDFFVTVESGSNPQQCTAVVRGGYPKVVHFRDRIIINVRDSMLEPRVVFRVWELNIAGSEQLCSVELSAQNIIHYAKEAADTMTMNRDGAVTAPKRFAMHLDNGLETVGLPWMSVNFLDVGIAPGHFDDNAQSGLTGHKILMSGRLPTLLEPDEESVVGGGGVSFSCCGRSKPPKQTTMPMQAIYDMEEFKESVSLLNRDGAPMGKAYEPTEEELREIECCRNMQTCILYTHISLCVVGIPFYVFWRTRVWSCYRQVRRIAAAELIQDLSHKNVSIQWQGTINLTVPRLPMTTRDLRLFWEQCQKSIEGLDLEFLDERDLRRYCSPKPDEVEHHCNLIETEKNMSVRAFRDFAEWLEQSDQWSGLQSLSNNLMKDKLSWFSGCYPSVCWQRNHVWMPIGDTLIPVLVVLLLLSICCWMPCFNRCIHEQKNALAASRKPAGEKKSPRRKLLSLTCR